MKTISVKQPWAYLLCAGIKDIENRTWKLPEKYKGKRVLIHASGKPDKEPYMILNEEQVDAIGDRIMDVCASYDSTSAIIGSVVFSDCVINHPSVWAEKTPLKDAGFAPSDGWLLVAPDLENITYNWVVSDPIIFDYSIFNVKGRLNFWDYEPESTIDRNIINHILDDISI